MKSYSKLQTAAINNCRNDDKVEVLRNMTSNGGLIMMRLKYNYEYMGRTGEHKSRGRLTLQWIS